MHTMAAPQSEEPSSTFPWYMKFFEYWRNRNRVSPGRVELPDCDFFIVGPRRTLRILRPTFKSGWYYENNVNGERPDSINDNFFTRWSRRPHSSGNCRCSFRRSSRLNSTTEEQLISAELNRIRTSLCEAEKTGQNIEELEKRLSVDLQRFQTSEVSDPGLTIDQYKAVDQVDEQSIKNRIVKDLERYINTLLEEILDDTVKFIAGTNEVCQEDVKKTESKAENLSFNVCVHRKLENNELNSETDHEKCKTNHGICLRNKKTFNDISFSFHTNCDKQKVDKKIDLEIPEGYVNQAFLGSTNDPDNLDFYHRQTAVSKQMVLDQLDCVDSGINSVETIEFQPEQETSLEQSLLRIIDEKLGRKTPPEDKLTNCALPCFDVKEYSHDDGKSTKTKIKLSDKGTQCTRLNAATAQNLCCNEHCGETPNSCDLPKTLYTTGNSSVAVSMVTDLVDEEVIQSNNNTSNKTNDQLIIKNTHSDVSSQNNNVNGKIIDNDIVQQAKKSFLTALSRKHQTNSNGKTDNNCNISVDNVEVISSPSPKVLEETSTEPNFDNLRLVFQDASKESSLALPETDSGNCKVAKFCDKLCTNIDDSSKVLKRSWNDKLTSFDIHRNTSLPIELEDYRRKWPDVEETNPSSTNESINNLVICRENRKPTIVFLHGFGSSAEIFEHQLKYFSALGYPCIAPDMLGHGMSSAPGNARDYNFGKLLKDLDAVLHHYAFAPGQKCVLVAHNYGCSFATALACKYDTNIHQLVLISGGGPTPLAPPSTESAGHWCLRAILTPFLMCGLHRGILYSARGRQHPYCGPEPPEQWPSHMKYVLDGMIWSQGDYVFHRRICTPTLLVHGLRDNKVSLVQECQMERTMLKAFLEAMPAAGHSPMTDCPDQLNHMIHCFIDLWKNKKWQQ